MLRVRDIMTTSLETVTPETTLRDAMELLGRRHLSGAPVVSGSALVGVVSATDLMAFTSVLSGVPTANELGDTQGVFAEPDMADEVDAEREAPAAYFSELWDDAGADVATRFDSIAGPEWNVLDEHEVSEVMTPMPLMTVSPGASVTEAAELMTSGGVHRVLVTEHGKLVGIVTALDVANAAAAGKLTARRYTFNHDGDFRDDG